MIKTETGLFVWSLPLILFIPSLFNIKSADIDIKLFGLF